MALIKTRTFRNDGSSTCVLADHEPAGHVCNRVQSLEAQAVTDLGNPSVTLGTYDRGDVTITLPSQRPSGAASQD